MEITKLLQQWVKTDEKGRSTLYTAYLNKAGERVIKGEPITKKEAKMFAEGFK